ncbi:MAG: hypothetical protein BWY82_01836 [Verrucomicrobia bacterium ADurb.Bin474]|nr:MAG: hypothetical protein BWY82_01836 [Verrucomicrobia bacterium ADurb.Bin474]
MTHQIDPDPGDHIVFHAAIGEFDQWPFSKSGSKIGENERSRTLFFKSGEDGMGLRLHPGVRRPNPLDAVLVITQSVQKHGFRFFDAGILRECLCDGLCRSHDRKGRALPSFHVKPITIALLANGEKRNFGSSEVGVKRQGWGIVFSPGQDGVKLRTCLLTRQWTKYRIIQRLVRLF